MNSWTTEISSTKQCRDCGKPGHVQMDCERYLLWLAEFYEKRYRETRPPVKIMKPFGLLTLIACYGLFWGVLLALMIKACG